MASQQRRRVRKPYTDSYGNCNHNTTAISDGHGYCNSDNNATAVPDGYCDRNSNSDGFAERDADTLGDPASADAKAAAYAVSSADALRMKDPDSRVIGDQ